MTKYIFIKRELAPILGQAITKWQAQNEGYKAVLVGCYQDTLDEPNQNEILGIKEFFTDSFLKINRKLIGFFVSADDNQLTPETWAQVSQIGKIFETAQEVIEFQNAL